MKITRFEDIQGWQKARILSQRIYQISASGLFSKDYGLRDQIRRAAVSIMANIAEGFERDGNKEFVQFLSVAKSSAGEVKSHCYVALDAGFLDREQFENLYRQADETGKLIAGFMRYLRQSELRGKKLSNHQQTTVPVSRNVEP
jgi:four helix bundle protein